jgi:hypothetical protein
VPLDAGGVEMQKPGGRGSARVRSGRHGAMPMGRALAVRHESCRICCLGSAEQSGTAVTNENVHLGPLGSRLAAASGAQTGPVNHPRPDEVAAFQPWSPGESGFYASARDMDAGQETRRVRATRLCFVYVCIYAVSTRPAPSHAVSSLLLISTAPCSYCSSQYPCDAPRARSPL